MKSTGIIRPLDGLGRVLIPKEIRRTLNLHEDDPMEIFVEGDKLILSKYFPMGRFVEEAGELARSFHHVVNSHIVVTDNEKVIATSWDRFDGVKLSDALIEAIKKKTDVKGVAIEASADAALAKHVAIIKCGGNDSMGQSIGAVALVDDKSPISDLLMPQVKMIADFLGRLAALNGGVL